MADFDDLQRRIAVREAEEQEGKTQLGDFMERERQHWRQELRYERGCLTDEDLAAMFAYLKTLKPINHHVDNQESATLCPLDGTMHGAGNQNKKE